MRLVSSDATWIEASSSTLWNVRVGTYTKFKNFKSHWHGFWNVVLSHVGMIDYLFFLMGGRGVSFCVVTSGMFKDDAGYNLQ